MRFQFSNEHMCDIGDTILYDNVFRISNTRDCIW